METTTAVNSVERTLIHEEPKTQTAIGLPDEHYKRIITIAKAKKSGVCLKNKNGLKTRFYMDGDELFGKTYMADGESKIEPVMSISDAIMKQSSEKSIDNLKSNLRKKISQDFPSYTAEEVEAFADIIEEGHYAVRRLVASGIDLKVANNIIFSTLNSSKENLNEEYIRECLTAKSS